MGDLGIGNQPKKAFTATGGIGLGAKQGPQAQPAMQPAQKTGIQQLAVGQYGIAQALAAAPKSILKTGAAAGPKQV